MQKAEFPDLTMKSFLLAARGLLFAIAIALCAAGAGQPNLQDASFQLSPSVVAVDPAGTASVPETSAAGTFTPQGAGPIAPAGGQPAGALSGRIVFTSAGHGWTYLNGSPTGTGWATQRDLLNTNGTFEFVDGPATVGQRFYKAFLGP